MRHIQCMGAIKAVHVGVDEMDVEMRACRLRRHAQPEAHVGRRVKLRLTEPSDEEEPAVAVAHEQHPRQAV